MHTAAIGGTPMFLQPPNPVSSASSTPGTGRVQGMAYGFSNDENPTPTATAVITLVSWPSSICSGLGSA